MDTTRRHLIVVRHAKSAWPEGVPDRSRPLAERGRADAPLVGAALRERVGAVDLAVVSPALRARQTWELLAEQLDDTPTLVVDKRIYEDWGLFLLDVVRDLPESALSAVIVGHEPGLSRLVLGLAGSSGGAARDRVAVKFPTCAVASLSCPAWPTVSRGSAQLEWFMTPRDLRARD